MKHSYNKHKEKSVVTLLLPNDISEVGHPPCLNEMRENKTLFGQGGALCFFNVESYFGMYWDTK